jgi:hypothetical protein
MPSHDLLVYCIHILHTSLLIIFNQLYFQSDLTLIRSWYLDGRHYSRTLEDWLQRQDRNALSGLTELENDAQARGLSKQEGRKAFYR